MVASTRKQEKKKKGNKDNNSQPDGGCVVCEEDATLDERILTCVGCGCDHHNDCVGVSRQEYDTMKNKSNWACSTSCKQKAEKRKTVVVGFDLTSDAPSLREIMKGINDIKSSQDFICEKYDQLNIKLDQLTGQCKSMVKRIVVLEKENETLKSKLHGQANGQHKATAVNDQQSFECNVIISGVSNEVDDIPATAKKIFAAVDDGFDDATIAKAERLFQPGPKTDGKIDKIPIVVTLTSSESAGKIVKAFRKKGTLVAEECDVPGDSSKLYIKEQLSHHNLVIMKECRKLKQEGKLKFVWFQNMSVLVRAEDTSKIIRISSKEDLQKIG